MNRNESRSASSCAACKLLKRKCTPNCIFAPYFQSNETHKFAKIHKVFGASNASKLLNEVPHDLRAETVNSLVYEAEARLNDPVYGCIGAMALLQNRMVQLQHDLALTRAHLACYTDCYSLPNPVADSSYDPGGNGSSVGGAPFSSEKNSDIPNSFELQHPPDEKLSCYPYGTFCQPY